MRNPRQRGSDLPKGLGRDLVPGPCESRVGALLYCLWSSSAAQSNCWPSHASRGLGALHILPPLRWPCCANQIDALHASSFSSQSLCSSCSFHLASFSFFLSTLEYLKILFFFVLDLAQIYSLLENSLYLWLSLPSPEGYGLFCSLSNSLVLLLKWF